MSGRVELKFQFKVQSLFKLNTFDLCLVSNIVCNHKLIREVRSKKQTRVALLGGGWLISLFWYVPQSFPQRQAQAGLKETLSKWYHNSVRGKQPITAKDSQVEKYRINQLQVHRRSETRLRSKVFSLGWLWIWLRDPLQRLKKELKLKRNGFKTFFAPKGGGEGWSSRRVKTLGFS